ncbi:MAG TPA: Ig-like domain-containing protein [Solirubrobacterales bacterium]|nr:Ig-like domain-containing protein [Solirubrobacterales bacterium]
MNTTTHRPAHLRRIGLAALCIVLAYIGFASAAKTAGAATPVIVNNGTVADRSSQKNWLSSTTTGGHTNDGANRTALSLFIQHDPGRKVTGLRIDEDYNGTDNSATATIRPVTGEQPVTINGYSYSKVDYTYNNSVSGLSSWSCSFLSQTWSQERDLFVRARLDNGEETAGSGTKLRLLRADNCGQPALVGGYQPILFGQTQSATSVVAGGSVNFGFTNVNRNTATLSTGPSGIRYRLRNSLTGAVSGTTEVSGISASVTFPDRGHYVVEAKSFGNPLTGGTTERNEWLYVGQVDVNSPPTASFDVTRPVHNGSTSINATSVVDPDSGDGGLIQDVMWDLDFNPTNGVGGFEVENLGTYNTGVSGPSLYSKSIDTTGFTPGWYPVRMKLRDNGAYSGADASRGEPIYSDQFLVDSIPVADDDSTNLESDETKEIALPTSDADVYPSQSIDDDANLDITIIDQPDHGTVTSPDDKDVTYDPDNDFSGYDTFTYQSDDGWGGIDTGVITVRVDPATDWEAVPSTSGDIDARGVAPEFSSPTEGSTFVKFECSLDFDSWYDCASADEINDLDDGLHNLRVRTHGGDDTVDPTPVETEWVIDATPTVSFTDTPTPDSGDESPSFAFEISEPGNTAAIDTRCKVEGPDQSGEFQPCTSPFALTDLNDGQYKVTVKVTDQYGKTSSSSYEWEIAVGGVHTWIVDSPPAFSASSDAEFSFETTDPTNTFECNLDGAGWASCSTPVQLLNLGEGEHTFEVRAVSAVNIADTTPASWQFTVDTTAPSTSVNGTVPARTNQSIALTFGSSENDSTFKCSIDEGNFEPCSTPYSSPVLNDGTHTLDVVAIDRAGNTDPSPVRRTWVTDTVAPVTSIEDGPAAGSLLNTSAADFEFEASETSTLQCKMDDQSWRDCDSVTEHSYRGLADGGHTFSVRATDLAGNLESGPPSRSWDIDTKAPVVGIDDGPAGTVKSAAASFKFSSSEAGVVFECKVDGNAFDDCSSPNAISGLSDGSHTFTVRAVDQAGNASEHPAQRSWTVDTSPVKPPVEKPGPEPETTCNLLSTEAKCSAPVVTAVMKKIGKKPGKNASVVAGVDAGKTALSSVSFALNSKAKLSLSKKAKSKVIARVAFRKADGTSSQVSLRVPKKTKPGARGSVKLTGTGVSATLKRGKSPSISIAGVPEGVTSISVGLKGKGLTIKNQGCATQKVVSLVGDREGNSAKASTFVDPPCLRTKTKGAR